MTDLSSVGRRQLVQLIHELREALAKAQVDQEYQKLCEQCKARYDTEIKDLREKVALLEQRESKRDRRAGW